MINLAIALHLLLESFIYVLSCQLSPILVVWSLLCAMMSFWFFFILLPFKIETKVLVIASFNFWLVNSDAIWKFDITKGFFKNFYVSNWLAYSNDLHNYHLPFPAVNRNILCKYWFFLLVVDVLVLFSRLFLFLFMRICQNNSGKQKWKINYYYISIMLWTLVSVILAIYSTLFFWIFWTVHHFKSKFKSILIKILYYFVVSYFTW